MLKNSESSEPMRREIEESEIKEKQFPGTVTQCNLRKFLTTPSCQPLQPSNPTSLPSTVKPGKLVTSEGPSALAS